MKRTTFLLAVFLILIGIEAKSLNIPWVSVRLKSSTLENLDSGFTNGHYSLPKKAEKRSSVTPQEQEKIQKYLLRAVIQSKLRKKWQKLTKAGFITEELAADDKLVTFAQKDRMAVKDVFHYLQYFPLLYEDVTTPVIFKIPVDGEIMQIRMEHGTGANEGKFIAKHIYTDPTGQQQEKDLSTLHNPLGTFSTSEDLKTVLQKTIEDTMPNIFDNKLDGVGEFSKKLEENKGTVEIAEAQREEAFREGFTVMATSALSDFQSNEAWLATLQSNLREKSDQLDEHLKKEIHNDDETLVKYELTVNMIETDAQSKARWMEWINRNIVTEKVEKGVLKEIVIEETGQVTAKEVFRQLQSFYLIYPQSNRANRVKVTMPLGKQRAVFYIAKPLFGKLQIGIGTKDSDYPNARRMKSEDALHLPSYAKIVDEILANVPNKKSAAAALLDACENKLSEQPNFETELGNPNNPTETAEYVRAAIEFLTITMIAESARPSDVVKTTFLRDIIKYIDENKRFPPGEKMPNLERLGGTKRRRENEDEDKDKKKSRSESLKEGRTPGMDEFTTKLLREERNKGLGLDKIYTEGSYPARSSGGTRKGREQFFRIGDDPIPSFALRQFAASTHDNKKLRELIRESCKKRRAKRNVCSLDDINDRTAVDEQSIEVHDDHVNLEVYDRRDPEKRMQITVNVSPDDLAIPRLTKESFSQSTRMGRPSKFSKIHKGLAVHGIMVSALSAVDYFQRGDDVKGGIAVSQSLHTLGQLTGVNEIVKAAGKNLLRFSSRQIAKGLNMEKALGRFEQKVERFTEKAAGKIMGAIPVAGLAFDVYFIEQDVEELANLDLSNPADVKLLPLRVVDLVLDVSTTVLNLVGTACPVLEVITEPLVIALSIIRMAIDDFYIDIMEEMEKINWNSPWAGLEFLGALVKGIVEGTVDFLTGGLRRQMKNYQKQVEDDKHTVEESRHVENFFQIQGEGVSGERIDFNQGSVSSFGGFINFRLFDNGWATVEVGDVRGSHQTIKKSFKVNKNLKSIVLGIGESGDFQYKKQTAKLWFVIPMKHYNVICGANLDSSSMYGTYYGNSQDNTFYAVQNEKKPEKPAESKNDGEECNYGKMDINFITGNYHYNLYGRGGNDVFYLGPQMASVSGGNGKDVYIVQSDGGRTIVDNFAEDDQLDMIVVNVVFTNIECKKSSVDLDVIYSQSHHIRVSNWFISGDTTYYRHMSFRSLDGIIFVPKVVIPQETQTEPTQVDCNAVAIDKSSEKGSVTLSLEGGKYKGVKQVIGSDHEDDIIGNSLNNILDGGKGDDHLTGGKNEDTYIIRASDGCDTINNDAEDHETTTDVVIFDVPYKNIELGKSYTNDIVVFDRDNEHASCFTLKSWLLGERYQHLIISSKDNVVFKIDSSTGQDLKKVPLVLDYSSSSKGVTVDLTEEFFPNTQQKTGFDQVATVSDSPHDDEIIGNELSNFLSCTGGRDKLKGGKGSDNYVVKKHCRHVEINNEDDKQKIDLLLIEEDFHNLQHSQQGENLEIHNNGRGLVIVLKNWIQNENFQHIWLRTRDGITANIEETKLVAVEISKDPTECSRCIENGNCERTVVTYNLSEDPWTKVARFQLQSSTCSYEIIGNDLNNYIDAGSSNGFNRQVLQGGDGADTYVLKHGYGEFNKIKNVATDDKVDYLQVGLELQDIKIYFYGENSVILASKSRPSSLSVEIEDFFKNKNYQHLQVITSDKVVFEITRQHPFINVTSVDRSIEDSAQTIVPAEDNLLASAQTIQGSLSHRNILSGTNNTREINGGSKKDSLTGSDTDNILRGREDNDELLGNAGDDIVLGGDGDDEINGGDGNDYIYGGDGRDVIRGGKGSDTLAFDGIGNMGEGVTVDLSFGFGRGRDAEGDTYESIENVYGTIYKDTLIGSDQDNHLYGYYGDDTIIVEEGGSDKLVGGEGADRYILGKSAGVKLIDNYADDLVKDTLSLIEVSSSEACVFFIAKDLYIHIPKSYASSMLYHGDQGLTVILENWRIDRKCRHLKVIFSDTVWSSRHLEQVKGNIIEIDQSVNDLTINSMFQIAEFDETTVKLSWNAVSVPPIVYETKLSFMQMDVENPINRTIRNIDYEQSELTINTLRRGKHYLYVLYLEVCNATIAVSPSLMTFGQQRDCPAVNTDNSHAVFDPQDSTTHGTEVTMTCNAGYKLDNEESCYFGTCVDGKWQNFPVPICIPIHHCSDLTSPRDGHVTALSKNEGSIAHYVCKKGFQLDGASERVCQISGQWQYEDPTCVAMRCGSVPQVENGKLEVCKHMERSKIHGTFTDPRQGFCVKVTCNENYVESYEIDKSIQPPIWESYGSIPNGAIVCKEGQWIGYRQATCEPNARLIVHRSTALFTRGHVEFWKNGRWVIMIETRNIQQSARLACSRIIPNYDEPGIKYKMRGVAESIFLLHVTCPRVRFMNPITPYEGALEIVINHEWQPLCISEMPITNAETLLITLCEIINWEMHVVQPVLVAHDAGTTMHRMRCDSATKDM